MATPKLGYNKGDEQLAKYAKALCAPAKIAILKTLSERRSCVCGEIVKITPLSQSTVSQHLKELRELGLVRGTIDGSRSCYCINPTGFSKFKRLFRAFLLAIDESKKSCPKT